MTEPQDTSRYYERLGGLESRMGMFEGVLRDLVTKVDTIATSVSQKAPFEPIKVLSFVVLLATLLSLSSACIIYIANATNSARIAVVEFQVQEVWKAGHWSPGVTTVAKSTPRTDARAQ